jgi:hypothetical protein
MKIHRPDGEPVANDDVSSFEDFAVENTPTNTGPGIGRDVSLSCREQEPVDCWLADPRGFYGRYPPAV